jgi:hypothetical protein
VITNTKRLRNRICRLLNDPSAYLLSNALLRTLERAVKQIEAGKLAIDLKGYGRGR